MLLGRRTCAACLSLLLIGITAGVTAARGARPGPASSDVVAIRKPAGSGPALPARLSSIDATILEDYDTFALVSLGPGARRAVEKAGLEIAEMPDRTRTGRGAYHFDTRLGEPRLPDELSVGPAGEGGYDAYIVQLIGPVKSDWIDGLRGARAEALLYLPSYSYLAAIERRDVERVRALRFVQWVGVYQPAYKLDPALLGSGAGTQTVSVAFLPGRGAERAEAILASSGGAPAKEWTLAGQRWMVATADRSALVALARLPEVFSIERFVTPSLVNDQATWVTQSNVPGSRSIHDKGLHGEGQLVTMSDEGIYAQHLMFNDSQPFGDSHRKIQACDHITGCPGHDPGCSDPGILHGTHVAGVIAGDAPSGTTYGTYNDHDGHAFLSRLVIQDMGPQAECLQYVDTDIANILYQPSFNKLSRIHNNSWGSQSAPPYCAGAIGTDQFTWTNPDYLVVFAAGNEGSSGPLAVRCEATAKDIITVGATLNGTLADQRWSSSSRGPTGNDGRRKPTVMAPGVDICSANDANIGSGTACVTNPTTSDYSVMSGTSFASPAVAGNVALARQYFTEGWYPSGAKTATQALTPSAALLKAVVVNGAQEMTGAGAYSDSTVKLVSGALQMTKALNSIDPASAVASQFGLDYGQPYALNVSLLVPSSVSLGTMAVADDGRVRAQISPATANKFTLQVLGGNGSQQTTLNRGIWHDLTVSYTPSSGTFHATVDDPPVDLGTFTFRGSALDQLTIGADGTAGSYGQFSVDDVCYSGSVTWCDSFTSLANWTITPAADDTGYPNNLQGWGRIDMDNSLYFSGEALKLLACDDRAGLRTGQQRVTKVQVTDTGQPLEATLVWSDRPGADPQHAITNNLDLVVRSPSGVAYRGNCFQGRNPGQSTSDPSCLADAVNVEEDVLRKTPDATGIWTVEVDAQNVDPSGGNLPQPFAVAVTGAIVSPTADVTVTAAADQQTSPGILTQGSYQSTFASDDVREGFQETLSGGSYSLTQIWRFENVPCRLSYLLHLEGYRPGNTSNDTFQFSWAPEVNGAPGTFQDIPSAIISLPFERTGGADFPFTAPGLSGTVYIRVKDRGTGSAQTNLYIDQLTVR